MGNNTPAFAKHNPLKWLWILPAVATIAAILLAASSLASVQSDAEESAFDPTNHAVIIEARRMSEQQKLDFDLAPQDIARVEIVGHRVSGSAETARSK